MLEVLAYAEPADPAASHLLTMVLCAGLIAVVCVLAFIPFAVACARRRVNLELISAACILWGLVASGSVVYATTAQLKWSQEQLVRLQTGYFDPADNSDAPTLPWRTWGGSAAAYGGLLAWTILQRKSGAAGQELNR